MSDRERYLRALEALNQLEEKLSEQRKTVSQLRTALEDRAYTHQRSGKRENNMRAEHCAVCGKLFQLGQEVEELVDDHGRVVRRRHYFRKDCR